MMAGRQPEQPGCDPGYEICLPGEYDGLVAAQLTSNGAASNGGASNGGANNGGASPNDACANPSGDASALLQA
jgi:hypothetical protein